MHGKRNRRIGDGCPPGFTDERLKQDICVLLDHIHGFYKAALDRLPMPSRAARLLEAGMCIGFLDPVSNIIANTIAYNSSPTPLRRSDEEETRESILSKIITDTNDKFVFEVPLSRHKAEGMTIARRSLDGLVTFLTSHYRYLAGTEALRYLLLAKADLLAAVRLIERDRNKKCNDELAFSIASRATKVALECAAHSARHPKPGVLVIASVIMASPNADSIMLLAGQDPSLAEFLRQGHMSMDRSLDLCGKEKNKKRKRKRQRSCQTSTAIESIVGSRAHNRLGSQTTFRYTQSLKLLLLGKIHGLYLQALAKLPRDDLCKRHHCSLLKGGYLYGPRDPVSNIILNTIWYGSLFPMPQEFTVDMICTEMLARIECCSLYGLVAFLRTYFPYLTEHDAVWYLFSSDADLEKAIDNVKKHGHAVCDSYQNAYRQAAVASWHPDPNTMVKFAMSSFKMESTKLLPILQSTLTNGAVECLAMALPHTKSDGQLNQATSSSQVLSKKQMRFISELRKKFKHDQAFFVRKVNAVLSNYSRQQGVGASVSVVFLLLNSNLHQFTSICLNHFSTYRFAAVFLLPTGAL
jgi:hypothetical protein